MTVDGEDVKAKFLAKIDGNTLMAEASYAGSKTGVKMSVQPGNDSYLMTKHVKRKATVEGGTIKKTGGATINEVTVGTSKYVINEETGRLESEIGGSKNFDSGILFDEGMEKNFDVAIKLNYGK